MAATQVAEEDFEALFDTKSADRQREIISAQATQLLATKGTAVVEVNLEGETTPVGPDGM